MNKTIILGIAVAGVLVTGLIAFMPEVSSVPTLSTERDSTTITDIKLKNGQRLVLVDNAGIGGTSDFEVTWRFDPTKCGLERINQFVAGPGVTFTTFGALFGGAPNDGAMGGNPPHRDLSGDGISLFAKSGEKCKLDSNKGQFVTVSTVGSTP